MNQAAPALPSLRREIARTLTLISTVWLLAVFFTMAFSIRHAVDDLMDSALQEAAEVLYGMLSMRATTLPMVEGGSMPAPPHDERLVWQIVDERQRVVMRSHKAPTTPLIERFQPGLSDAPGHWRVYAMRLPSGGEVLYVGQPGLERIESRYEAIALVGAGGVLVGLLCAVWMRRRVGQAMQLLQGLSDQVKQYDPMRTRPQTLVSTRQEFVEIRDAIVDLGSRLARRAHSEQAFAGHAAHALRTPLAGMEAQLAIAMKEADDAARPRLERMREAVVQLKRVIASLLALFRSQVEPSLQDVDLAELMSHIHTESLVVHVSQDGPLRADPDLLAGALANLLDNSLRYGARTCWVSCRSQGAGQYLTVRDDGPGESAQRRMALQEIVDQPIDEAFAGLGLKLAALVARAHKGRLIIDNADARGQGFSVTLVLWSDTGEPA